jgi:hypothetical protein
MLIVSEYGVSMDVKLDNERVRGECSENEVKEKEMERWVC